MPRRLDPQVGLVHHKGLLADRMIKYHTTILWQLKNGNYLDIFSEPQSAIQPNKADVKLLEILLFLPTHET